MSKKPASLTSDLLARKGEAEPSTIDPSARMTLSAGPGFDDHNNGGEYGGGRREPHLDDDDQYDDERPIAAEPELTARRPMPPEPEIIYTAEESHSGGSNARLAIIAVLGLVIVGGIFLGMSGQEKNTVAPVASVAPVATEGTTPDVASVTPAPETTAPVASAEATPETLTTTPTPSGSAPSGPTPSGNAPLNIAPNTTVPDASSQVAPLTEVPVNEAPVTQAAPVAETPAVEAPVKAAEPVAAPKAQSGGAYVVQLLALQDEASAKTAWKKVAKKYSNILGGHALDIEQADLGAKGTWYRVRAAGFKSKSAATSACAKLKAAGQDCMAKKR